MRYQDRHGNEMIEGMYIRFEDLALSAAMLLSMAACGTTDSADSSASAGSVRLPACPARAPAWRDATMLISTTAL